MHPDPNVPMGGEGVVRVRGHVKQLKSTDEGKGCCDSRCKEKGGAQVTPDVKKLQGDSENRETKVWGRVKSDSRSNSSL